MCMLRVAPRSVKDVVFLLVTCRTYNLYSPYTRNQKVFFFSLRGTRRYTCGCTRRYTRRCTPGCRGKLAFPRRFQKKGMFFFQPL